MGKPHPISLYRREVTYVEEELSHRPAAARFRVSVKFVNDTVISKRETRSLQPRQPGDARCADDASHVALGQEAPK